MIAHQSLSPMKDIFYDIKNFWPEMQLKLLIVTMKYNFPGVKFAHKKADKEFNKYHRLVHLIPKFSVTESFQF